ncbi:uncharacterized protein [Clytia hemisphaerica]|uniref:uncharacterized protein isoform X2 n=1 Tax=Clytia hemisphaerica TaxID=252671 RepID=UPI0034D47EC2
MANANKPNDNEHMEQEHLRRHLLQQKEKLLAEKLYWEHECRKSYDLYETQRKKNDLEFTKRLSGNKQHKRLLVPCQCGKAHEYLYQEYKHLPLDTLEKK